LIRWTSGRGLLTKPSTRELELDAFSNRFVAEISNKIQIKYFTILIFLQVICFVIIVFFKQAVLKKIYLY